MTSHLQYRAKKRGLLVIHPGALGDVLLARPVLLSFRDQFPQHEIALLWRERPGLQQRVFDARPAVVRFIGWDRGEAEIEGPQVARLDGARRDGERTGRERVVVVSAAHARPTGSRRRRRGPSA